MCMVSSIGTLTLTVTRSFLTSCWVRIDACKIEKVDNIKLFGSVTGIAVTKRKRKLRLVVAAELSKFGDPAFGSDSQIVQSYDLSKLPWIGPAPGDIAELEAYCRIFRAAECLHSALMETLCDPVTAECRDTFVFTVEDKPMMEDKIVSLLGRMVALINKGKEDVFSGRAAIMNVFRDGEHSLIDEKLPPLALFRGEMKKCCENLHVTLESILIPEQGRGLDVWQKLQQLMNVCYDAGFPRCDKWPAHTLFANWSPVYLSSSKEDTISSEAAFWKGGQVTEDGLHWLIDNGFKTIVDLRAETVFDQFYEAAVADATFSKKIELITIPVEVKTAPSMDQVEKFSSLVADASKYPIYLHSKEGVWRTSAMISRWREYKNRTESHNSSRNSMESKTSNGVQEVQSDAGTGMNSLLIESNDGTHILSRNDEEKDDHGENASNGYVPQKGSYAETDDDNLKHCSSIKEINPLKAQLPPMDVFSRDEMSKFLTTRISPPLVNNSMKSKKIQLPISGLSTDKPVIEPAELTSSAMAAETEVGQSEKSVLKESSKSNPRSSNSESAFLLNGNGHVSKASNLNPEDIRRRSVPTTVDSFSQSDSRNVTSTSLIEKSNKFASSSSTGEDEVGSIEGNMCASTTGVVRVQSRKKAEMFLVRTDGFSCTREKVNEASLAFTHPSTQQQMLMWKSPPKTVLLLKKLGDDLIEEAKEVASFLYHQEKMNVLVEPDVHDIFARMSGFGFVQTFYSQDTSNLHERVDFVACLGGDGVILHASNLFRNSVPPIVSFNLGSLGFLTSHPFEDFRHDLKQLIHGNQTSEGVYITLRMRLKCEIFRSGIAIPGKIFEVLNEVVVDRGSNPYLSKIECYERDRLITKVQGDGVIVATPTGSTAYSTAAGGSMVHPNVPCILFTPICPHSLSFRPVILPDSAMLELKIPEDARSNAWVSFDGKRRQQLSRGYSVRISMSEHPLPTVNKSDQTGDWFHSLVRCLNWNDRLDQKAL